MDRMTITIQEKNNINCRSICIVIAKTGKNTQSVYTRHEAGEDSNLYNVKIILQFRYRIQGIFFLKYLHWNISMFHQ